MDQLFIVTQHLWTGFTGRVKMKTKFIFLLTVVAALSFLGHATPGLAATSEDGVALAIIYDTSGSMKETVPDQSGKSAPKYVIANRALGAIAKQIATFATNNPAGAPRKIYTGLFVFHGQGARAAVQFGPFDEAALAKWAGSFSNPGGNTPLGNALVAASHAVLHSPLSRKHVLVITDGMNTAGPTPATVLPRLARQARQKQTGLSFHFVAFDVDAKVFAPLKRLGATVVGASDEKQLNSQLEFILQRKILLEDEEPKH